VLDGNAVMELDGPASFVIMMAVIALLLVFVVVILYFGFRIGARGVRRLLAGKDGQ